MNNQLLNNNNNNNEKLKLMSLDIKAVSYTHLDVYKRQPPENEASNRTWKSSTQQSEQVTESQYYYNGDYVPTSAWRTNLIFS